MPADAANWRLSPRELEVVAHVAEGLLNAQIAEKLNLSERTVQSHVANAMAKSGARTRTHLVVLALRSGALPLEGCPEIRAGAAKFSTSADCAGGCVL